MADTDIYRVVYMCITCVLANNPVDIRYISTLLYPISVKIRVQAFFFLFTNQLLGKPLILPKNISQLRQTNFEMNIFFILSAILERFIAFLVSDFKVLVEIWKISKLQGLIKIFVSLELFSH